MSEIHNHGHIHENQKAVVNRLARAIGHLNKVKRMVEEGYDCTEVLVQLAEQLKATGNSAAYEQVLAAVSDFEKGNMRLSMVLFSLNG